MNEQQQSAVLGTSPEAYALTLSQQELHDLSYALGETTFPESRAEIASAQRRALLSTRISKLLMSLVIMTAFLAHGWANAQSMPTVYLEGPEDFSTALTAALNKKHVPVQVTLDGEHADYILHASGVSNKTESGKSQVARCLFMDCIGAFGSSSVSVTLVKANSPSILWAYQVRKQVGGPLGTQSLSEAIAKHLKHDYFKE
jgi:hypothetical protein